MDLPLSGSISFEFSQKRAAPRRLRPESRRRDVLSAHSARWESSSPPLCSWWPGGGGPAAQTCTSRTSAACWGWASQSQPRPVKKIDKSKHPVHLLMNRHVIIIHYGLLKTDLRFIYWLGWNHSHYFKTIRLRTFKSIQKWCLFLIERENSTMDLPKWFNKDFKSDPFGGKLNH